MKTWNAAEIVELNITETANGLFPAIYEGVFGDNILDGNHSEDCGKGETPKDENETLDQRS